MKPLFDFGEAVRVTRCVRNDGTYPGRDTGALLLRSGEVGYVCDVGSFLQDQIIYTVDFVDLGIRVGCREHELILASDPWIDNRFEYRDKVTPIKSLAINGEIIANAGDRGEIEKILRDYPGGPAYHLHICGRTLLVTERVLRFIDESVEACL